MKFFTMSLFLSGVMAMWPHSWLVGYSCGKAAQAMFPQCNELDGDCYCSNRQYLASVANCITEHTRYNSTQLGSAWDRFLVSYCELKNADAIENDIFAAGMSHPNQTVSEVYYSLAYHGQVNNLRQKDVSVVLGCILIIFILLAMCSSAIYKWWFELAIRMSDRRRVMRRPPSWYRWLQKNFWLPALFHERHMRRLQFGWFTFSMTSRFDTVVIGIYCLLTFIFMLTPYTFMDADPFFPTRWKEMMRYSSDRSGIMATIQLPFFILLSMRNNLLISITGWSYSKFNVYHRAVGRICLILLFVHAVTKHVFSASYGASLSLYYYPVPYFRWGVSAVGLMTLMVASGSLRHRFYEFFLWLHIPCAIGALACSIKHLDGIGYKEPMYICFIIWGADVTIRILRIMIFNFSIFLQPLNGSQRTTYGTVKVYNKELTHLTVTLPTRWKAVPGQYVYLHLSRFSFLGGHPFSVLGSSPDGEGLELICKAREGFTKRLKDKLVRVGCDVRSPVTISAYVEGPYGLHAPVEWYDDVLVFAGGIGITGVMQYVERACKAQVERRNGAVRVKLVWVVQKGVDFQPLIQRILRLLDKRSVQIELYCRTAGVSTSHLDNSIGGLVTTDPTANLSLKSSALRPVTEEIDPFATSENLTLYDSSSRPITPLHPQQRLFSNSSPTNSSASSFRTRVGIENLHKAGLIDSGFTDNVHFEKEPDLHHFSSFTSNSQTSEVYTLADIAELIQEKRLNIPPLIKERFVQTYGSIAVLGCGPPRMMDAIRQSVCASLDLVKHGRVDYFEEAFSW